MNNRGIWGTLDPFLEHGEIMGRTVANAGFLDALLRADPFPAYHFFPRDPGAAVSLKSLLHERYPSQRERLQVFPRRDLPQALRHNTYHCFHLSDCINHPPWLARLRNAYSEEIFPITSVTHSLSYASYPREFLAHLWPGATKRDAIAATSRTGREVVRNFFKVIREEYSLAGQLFLEPSVELVPLGVDCSVFTPPDEAARHRLRGKWDIPPDARVVLVFGRIAHHSKMDLVPALRTVRRAQAAEGVDRPVVLMLAGWTLEGDDYPDALANLAARMGVDLRIIARPDDGARLELFSLADIFFSPSDNLQETFGLTILEAGAMGLPVAASDFDGYRDLVVDGETGVLTPTLALGETVEEDLLAGGLPDSYVHLRLAQATAVDVARTAELLGALLRESERAKAIGKAGRERVETHFDWSVVIRRWVELWDELWRRPVDAAALRELHHPLAMRHGRVFAGYATETLQPDMQVRWTEYGEAVYRKRDGLVLYAGMEDAIAEEGVRTLLFLARKPAPVHMLVDRLREKPGLDAASARRHVVWALKQDLLERVRDA